VSQTKRYLIAAFVILLLGGAILAVRWVVTIPWVELRSVAINSYSVIPAAMVRLELRRALQESDFDTAQRLLRRQKAVAEAIGPTNFMKFDLVQNTGLAMRQARLVGKPEYFAAWLAELRKLAPREYRLLPMLAHSLAQIDPDAAAEAANEALAILPIDEAPYRALINSSLAHDPSRLNDLCKRHRAAQIGSFNVWYFQHRGAFDQDLRTVMFMVKTPQGEALYGISHGVELGTIQTAEFNIEQNAPLPRFNLILPTIPGIKITIHEVQFESPLETKTYGSGQLYLTPTNGFVLSPNEIVLTSEFGDNIAIQAKGGSFPPFHRLTLTYEIDKLAISNSPDCLTKMSH